MMYAPPAWPAYTARHCPTPQEKSHTRGYWISFSLRSGLGIFSTPLKFLCRDSIVDRQFIRVPEKTTILRLCDRAGSLQGIIYKYINMSAQNGG